MENIAIHSIHRASEEAVTLWSFASTQFPLNNRLIQQYADTAIIEVVSSFALNARRAMEILPPKVKYPLGAGRWEWRPKNDGEKVADLWDALNRIIHARKLHIGFELLPEKIAVIPDGAIVVPYIQAQTDRKELAFIDPFSLSHTFLYAALPALIEHR